MVSDFDQLTYKDDWKEAQERTEAWWHGKIIDRPAIRVTAPKAQVVEEANGEDSNYDREELEDYFTNPETVIPRLKERMKNTFWGGEAFPVMYPVSISMVAILSNYLGCPLKFVTKDTTWSEPVAERWEDLPDLTFNRENRWWKKSKKLLSEASKQAPGSYYVGVPDLNGPSEILSRLRGTERLAKDTIRRPKEVKEAIDKITYAWYRYWQAAQGTIHQHIGGYVFWMGIWSDIAAIDLQSDFSCMISPESFEYLILPSLRRQTEWVSRTIYHLDGPDAVKHLDALLSLEKLDGIQWVPGAGAPPASKWISLLRRIQEAGKLVHITVGKAEIPILLDKLDPEGLMMNIRCETESEAREVLEMVEEY